MIHARAQKGKWREKSVVGRHSIGKVHLLG